MAWGERDPVGVVACSPDVDGDVTGAAEDRIRADEWPSAGNGSAFVAAAKHNMVVLVLLTIIAALAVASPTFRSAANVENVFDQDVTLAIVASGMLCMMLTGGFDLSVGAAGATSAVTAAWVSIHCGIAAGSAAGLAAGLGIGLINGLCVAFLNVNPFVTTLGSMTLWYGVLDLLTGGSPLAGTPAGWTHWGLRDTGPIPNPVFIGAAVVALVYLLLRHTLHGGHIYAVGSNMGAAARAGINVRVVLCSVYTVGGLLAAVAGLVTVSQSGVGDPATGSDWALTAIAAIVIGGTRLSGGVGGVRSVIAGTLLLTIMANALTLYNVSPFWVPVMAGMIVIVAVAISANSGRVSGSLIKSRQL